MSSLLDPIIFCNRSTTKRYKQYHSVDSVKWIVLNKFMLPLKSPFRTLITQHSRFYGSIMPFLAQCLEGLTTPWIRDVRKCPWWVVLWWILCTLSYKLGAKDVICGHSKKCGRAWAALWSRSNSFHSSGCGRPYSNKKKSWTGKEFDKKRDSGLTCYHYRQESLAVLVFWQVCI